MKEKKKQLRKLIKERKNRESSITLKYWSEQILSKLEEHPVFKKAEIILLYFSMEDEVNTRSFIEKWATHKIILLPVVNGANLELRRYHSSESMSTGAFGIKEPCGEPFTEYDEIDLAVVPGMAFDKVGCRLGRGKGYYDKLLTRLHAYTIGICFPFQLLDEEIIPLEEFDKTVDEVLSI